MVCIVCEVIDGTAAWPVASATVCADPAPAPQASHYSVITSLDWLGVCATHPLCVVLPLAFNGSALLHLYFSTLCCWVFYVSVLILFDLFVHVAPTGAPAWAMKGKEGLPFTRTRGLLAYWRGPHLRGR